MKNVCNKLIVYGTPVPYISFGDRLNNILKQVFFVIIEATHFHSNNLMKGVHSNTGIFIRLDIGKHCNPKQGTRVVNHISIRYIGTDPKNIIRSEYIKLDQKWYNMI